MSRLVFPINIKAVTDANGVHTFEGLAATWAQDLGNDVITKGAFKKTIAQWKASGDALPLLNSHDSYDICSAIGQLMDAQETKDGLWTKFALLPGPEGDMVHTRLMPHPMTGKPTVGKMSIGYEPVKFSYEQPEGTTSYFDQIRHLEEISLKEVSLVLFPMNEGATIDASTVKQFTYAIKGADPTLLDGLTRQQLRELSGRIGNLLKKQAPEDGKDGKEEKDGKDGKGSSTPAAPPSRDLHTPETPEELEAEELEIAREILDGEETDAANAKRKKRTPVVVDDTKTEDGESDPPAPSSGSSDAPHEPLAPVVGEQVATEDQPGPQAQPDAKMDTYLYSEALLHRLKKLKIARIASGAAREDDTD